MEEPGRLPSPAGPGRRRVRRTAGPAALAAGLLALAGCRAASDADRRLFEESCARCHSLEIPLSKRKSEAGWRKTVWVMRQRGAQLTDEESEGIVRYLARVRAVR